MALELWKNSFLISCQQWYYADFTNTPKGYHPNDDKRRILATNRISWGLKFPWWYHPRDPGGCWLPKSSEVCWTATSIAVRARDREQSNWPGTGPVETFINKPCKEVEASEGPSWSDQWLMVIYIYIDIKICIIYIIYIIIYIYIYINILYTNILYINILYT